MKNKKITRLTVEVERVFTFRNSNAVQLGWCLTCGSESRMSTVAGAARESGLNEWAVYQLLHAHAFHFSEDREGRVLVCLNSLRRNFAPAEIDNTEDNSNQKGESHERDE